MSRRPRSRRVGLTAPPDLGGAWPVLYRWGMTTGARDSSAAFLGKVEVPRAADVLADRLRRGILAGQLRPGELLPPERKLVDQTGLGRASVREALRMLEVEDL